MFHPFHVVHYNPTKTRDWRSVLTPPYDVLSEEQKAALKKRSPFNFAHVDVPTKSAQGYEAAAAQVREWLKDGVLLREKEPGLILYELTFQFQGRSHTRLGVMGVMDLASYKDGSVMPHERTLAPAKEDRFALLQATQGHLSPIFVMTQDPENRLQAGWSEWIQQGKLLMDMTDDQGFRHVLTMVYEDTIFSEFDAIMQSGGGRVMIVDGHHRYETSLAYSEKMTAAKGHGPWNRVLTYMTVVEDPELLLLATHRVVHSVPDFSAKAAKLDSAMRADGWSAHVCNSLSHMFSLMGEFSEKENTITWIQPDQFRHRPESAMTLWTRPKNAGVATPKKKTAVAAALPKLDVALLQDTILKGVLGMTQEDLDQKKYLNYVTPMTENDLLPALQDPKSQAVFVISPCRKQDVYETACQGVVLPQKSTFFYPKILSGTALYLFDAEVGASAKARTHT